MPDESNAADVVLDRDYPNVDFTPLRLPAHALNGHAPKPPQPLSRWAKAFRFLRKLIRQRQESAVVKSVKWQALENGLQERKRHDDAIKTIALKAAEEGRATSKELATLTKRIEQRDTALSELRQKMDLKVEELSTTIASREKDIKNHVELEIPKLQRELEVTRAEVKYWKTLVAEKLIHEEAQIAVDNKRITDAEAVIEQIRNSNTLQQLMERGR